MKNMIPKCVDDCPYRNLLKEAEQKLQQEKNNELHRCKEQNKSKDRKLKALNKKVINSGSTHKTDCFLIVKL